MVSPVRALGEYHTRANWFGAGLFDGAELAGKELNMTDPDQGGCAANKSGQSEQKVPVGKKAYVKPSFEWERAFETMALACGKINTTQAQCKFNRKNS
jgi:hypothetical protein